MSEPKTEDSPVIAVHDDEEEVDDLFNDNEDGIPQPELPSTEHPESATVDVPPIIADNVDEDVDMKESTVTETVTETVPEPSTTTTTTTAAAVAATTGAPNESSTTTESGESGQSAQPPAATTSNATSPANTTGTVTASPLKVQKSTLHKKRPLPKVSIPLINPTIPDLPELTRKDKTLKEVLELMDSDFQPIIPDIVTDYYLAKNGFETSDIRIKRLLALATQKFISDVAQDAYEYSRIRSASAVYNSSNPQVRAKALLQGQQFANMASGSGVVNGNDPNAANADGNAEGASGSNAAAASTSAGAHSAGNLQGKVVLKMADLSSALSEYGLNVTRPDFYR